MKLRFLVNPAAGSGRGARSLPAVERLASRLGAAVERSASAADLTARARAAAAAGVDRLVALGGDGTFHHVIRGLAGSRCELATVPLGTGNDLAAIAGAPRRLDRALAWAVEGDAAPYDLGRAVGGDRELTFGVYCGAGLDALVSRWARERPGKRASGRLVYVLGLLAVLSRFEPPEFRVEHDGGVFRGRGMLAVAANGYRFGGGMKIAPRADPTDGLLDLVIVRAVSRWRLLLVFPRVYAGRHVGHPAIEIVRTSRARLAVDPPLPLALDGEDGGEVGPAGIEATVERGALRLVRGA